MGVLLCSNQRRALGGHVSRVFQIAFFLPAILSDLWRKEEGRSPWTSFWKCGWTTGTLHLDAIWCQDLFTPYHPAEALTWKNAPLPCHLLQNVCSALVSDLPNSETQSLQVQNPFLVCIPPQCVLGKARHFSRCYMEQTRNKDTISLLWIVMKNTSTLGTSVFTRIGIFPNKWFLR